MRSCGLGRACRIGRREGLTDPSPQGLPRGGRRSRRAGRDHRPARAQTIFIRPATLRGATEQYTRRAPPAAAAALRRAGPAAPRPGPGGPQPPAGRPARMSDSRSPGAGTEGRSRRRRDNAQPAGRLLIPYTSEGTAAAGGWGRPERRGRREREGKAGGEVRSLPSRALSAAAAGSVRRADRPGIAGSGRPAGRLREGGGRTRPPRERPRRSRSAPARRHSDPCPACPDAGPAAPEPGRRPPAYAQSTCLPYRPCREPRAVGSLSCPPPRPAAGRAGACGNRTPGPAGRGTTGTHVD